MLIIYPVLITYWVNYVMAYQKQGEKGSGRSTAIPFPVIIPVFIDLLTAEAIRSFCEEFLLLPGAPRS